jgi:hypothetical protein
LVQLGAVGVGALDAREVPEPLGGGGVLLFLLAFPSPAFGDHATCFGKGLGLGKTPG